MVSDPNLSPDRVVLRFAELRRLCPIEQDADARNRLMREQPPAPPERFELAVECRLRELRALCELARYLHRSDPGR
jgi:hypothetical protein